MKFNEITGLKKDIRSALKKAGYEEMTPIQEMTYPVVMEGKDLIACAQTGTGKTAAFSLPILNRLAGDRKKTPRALILSPTRELAQQIFDNCKMYGRYLKTRITCIYGGAPQGPQIRRLEQGCDVLIATPGRLMDFANRGIVDLDAVEIFVLDEADRMLDMGFIPDIRKIETMIPEEHQAIMFSATMPKEIEALARDFLKEPEDIRVAATSSPADTVEQKICFVERDFKKDLLGDYLNRDEVKKSIVFTRTKHGADKLVKELDKQGIRSLSIHGDKTQGQRKNALERFRSGNVKVLVATDVASRGIDVPKISHVFNYDLPEEAESYIHRIGRAGRAGETGEAITLCCQEETRLLADIERLVKKEIPEEETEWTVAVKRFEKRSREDRRNFRGRRNNFRGKSDRNDKSGFKGGDRRDRKPKFDRKPRFEKKSDDNFKTSGVENGGYTNSYASTEDSKKQYRKPYRKNDNFKKRDGFKKNDDFKKKDGYKKPYRKSNRHDDGDMPVKKTYGDKKKSYGRRNDKKKSDSQAS